MRSLVRRGKDGLVDPKPGPPQRNLFQACFTGTVLHSETQPF